MNTIITIFILAVLTLKSSLLSYSECLKTHYPRFIGDNGNSGNTNTTSFDVDFTSGDVVLSGFSYGTNLVPSGCAPFVALIQESSQVFTWAVELSDPISQVL